MLLNAMSRPLEADSPRGVALATRRNDVPDPSYAIAIMNLLQSYALFADHNLRTDLATLFTADAVWDGTELGYGRAQGRADIVEAVLVHFSPDPPVIHLPGPPLLVRSGPRRVEAVSWCLASRIVDGVATPLVSFVYEDVIQRTPTGWAFQSRTLRRRSRVA
jgi:hypothetical protein